MKNRLFIFILMLLVIVMACGTPKTDVFTPVPETPTRTSTRTRVVIPTDTPEGWVEPTSTETSTPTNTPTETPPGDGSPASLPGISWLDVYFTDPGAPGARYYEGGPDEKLAAAIDGARLTVEVAAYNFNLWSIRDSLLKAWRRGVTIRMVTESDNIDSEEIQELVDAGIPVVGDRSESLMHQKFVVIDREEVWMGSMNFSVGGTYKDHNNLLRIRSAKVAEDYQVEFDEMFKDDRFGAGSLANTPNPLVTIDGTRVEIFFSPDDGVSKRIVELIEDAGESIHFLAYSFTSDEIGEAIRLQADAGLSVAGVMDADMAKSNAGTEFDAFMQSGLDVRLDGNDGLMHHKVIIIDRSIVITGSYNFTASAENQNDENVVILFNRAVAEKFLEQFEWIYAQAPRP